MNKKVDFDEYIENYNSLLSDATNFFSSSEEYFAKYKVSIAKRVVQNNLGNILEYGCGIGRNLPYLREAFPGTSLFGSDIAVASLDLAAKENPEINFFCEDGKVEMAEKFDLIFVAGVFHHVALAERQEVSKILFDRLRPNGTLIIFEHNPFNPVTCKIVNDCPYDNDALLLKPKELKNLLSNSGFSEVSSYFCLFFPPKFKKFLAYEKILSWLPLGGQYYVQATKKP
jgi:SAM-dependent methyltransferase